MLAFVVAVALSAQKTQYVFVQSNCLPCQRQKNDCGDGDDEVAVKYVNCDHIMPEGITAFPTTFDPETGRTHVGYLDFAGVKAFAGITPQPLAIEEAAHTPISEVVRVIALLPKPEIAFVDYGCGYDARWCVAAAEYWKCKAIGVEIDPARARAARERVRNLGLSHLITIVEGDATTVDVRADVGVAYLYPEVLVKLRPRFEKLRAFASYLHQPPGVQTTRNGDVYLYTRPGQVGVRAAAVWGGHTYTGRVCNNPNCAMCNSIQSQLTVRQPAAQVAANQPTGHYETRTQMQRVKVCNGRRCWYEDRPVQVQVWIP